MIEHIVQFENFAHFLRDYEAHLVHGGLLLTMTPAPEVYAKIKVTLILPPEQVSLSIEARVVAQFPHGVGVQLDAMDEAAKGVFNGQLAMCRSLAGTSDSPTQSPSPLPLPPNHEQVQHKAEEAAPQEELAPLDKAGGQEEVTAEDPASLSTPTLPFQTFNRSMLNKEISPALSFGAIESFLLPDEVTHSNVPTEQRAAPLGEQVNASRLATPDFKAPPFAAPAPLAAAPRTAPPIPPTSSHIPFQPVPESLSSGSQEFLGVTHKASPASVPAILPTEDVQLPYFPPEEINKEGLSPHADIAPAEGVSLEQTPTGWEHPNSSMDHFSVSAADWAGVTYSYDALPAAHFTPPPNTLSVPTTPTTTAPSLSGDLDESSCLDALLAFGTQGATGMFHLLGMDGTYNVFFHQGQVVYITEDPTPEEHLLGQVLIDLGHITNADRDAVMSNVRPSEQKFGEVLIELGIVTLREIAQGLRYQLQLRMGIIAGLTEGHFTFYDKRLPSKRTPLAPPTTPGRLLFRALIKTYGLRQRKEVTLLEEPYLSQLVVRTENVGSAVDELQLSTNEQAFWDELLLGNLLLQDIYKASTFPQRRTHATIFALYDLGLVQFQPET